MTTTLDLWEPFITNTTNPATITDVTVEELNNTLDVDCDTRDQLIYWIATSKRPSQDVQEIATFVRNSSPTPSQQEIIKTSLDNLIPLAERLTSAPLFSALAFCAWYINNPTKATELTQRALEINEDNRLAHLVRIMVNTNIAPLWAQESPSPRGCTE